MISFFKFCVLFAILFSVKIFAEDGASAGVTITEASANVALDGSNTNANAANPTKPTTTEEPPLRLGSLDVRLTISGQNFTVRFAPERQSSEDVARRLCTEKANEIGVTQENYQVCLNRVANYLQGFVDNWTREKILSFPIAINETEFSLRFIPELRNSQDLALEVCQQYSNVSGHNFENVETGCVAPIQNFIQRRVVNFFAEKTLEFPLTINENMTFDIRFLPERDSPVQLAQELCVRYAGQFNLTEETIQGACIVPVASYLFDRVEAWIRSKTLEFQFLANGQSYTISFLPERASSIQVAQRFCLRNARDFDLTEENFVSKCVAPMNEYIQSTILNWIDSKRLTVGIQIGDKNHNITFIPERQPTIYVARNFCFDQANALALNDETFVRDCVSPVNQILTDRLNAWVEERRKLVEARLAQQKQQQEAAAAQAAASLNGGATPNAAAEPVSAA